MFGLGSLELLASGVLAQQSCLRRPNDLCATSFNSADTLPRLKLQEYASTPCWRCVAQHAELFN
jgi:hypothetical protein